MNSLHCPNCGSTNLAEAGYVPCFWPILGFNKDGVVFAKMDEVKPELESYEAEEEFSIFCKDCECWYSTEYRNGHLILHPEDSDVPSGIIKLSEEQE